MILYVDNMSVFPHVFSKKMEGPSAYPLSLNQWALKNKMELRFFGSTQLVSKEWDIVNLEVVPDDNPEL